MLPPSGEQPQVPTIQHQQVFPQSREQHRLRSQRSCRACAIVSERSRASLRASRRSRLMWCARERRCRPAQAFLTCTAATCGTARVPRGVPRSSAAVRKTSTMAQVARAAAARVIASGVSREAPVRAAAVLGNVRRRSMEKRPRLAHMHLVAQLVWTAPRASVSPAYVVTFLCVGLQSRVTSAIFVTMIPGSNHPASWTHHD